MPRTLLSASWVLLLTISTAFAWPDASGAHAAPSGNSAPPAASAAPGYATARTLGAAVTSSVSENPDASTRPPGRGCHGDYQCVNGRCLDIGECRCDLGFLGRNCSRVAEFDVDGPAEGLRLRYTIDADAQVIHVEFSRSGSHTGWFALMLGSDDMVDGDVWVGHVEDTGVVTIQDRWSEATGMPRLDTTYEGGSDDLFDKGGWIDGNTQAVYFSRKLSTGDPQDAVIDIEGGDMEVGWATSGSGKIEGDRFSKHSFAKGGTINFSTGRARTRQRFLSHGIVMTIAWAGLASMGASAASRARLQTGEWTGFFRKAQQLFQFHRAVQSTALATMAVGFALAVAEGPPFYEWSFEHSKPLNSAHMVTGVTLTVLAFLQGFIAFAFHGNRAHGVHRLLGAGLLTTAWLWQMPSGAFMLWGRTTAILYLLAIPTFWIVVYMYQRSAMPQSQSEYRRLQFGPAKDSPSSSVSGGSESRDHPRDLNASDHAARTSSASQSTKRRSFDTEAAAAAAGGRRSVA